MSGQKLTDVNLTSQNFGNATLWVVKFMKVFRMINIVIRYLLQSDFSNVALNLMPKGCNFAPQFESTLTRRIHSFSYLVSTIDAVRQRMDRLDNVRLLEC